MAVQKILLHIKYIIQGIQATTITEITHPTELKINLKVDCLYLDACGIDAIGQWKISSCDCDPRYFHTGIMHQGVG